MVVLWKFLFVWHKLTEQWFKCNPHIYIVITLQLYFSVILLVLPSSTTSQVVDSFLGWFCHNTKMATRIFKCSFILYFQGKITFILSNHIKRLGSLLTETC